jgi:dihydroflavonol-4-reductase
MNLITGATGIVGAHVALKLLQNNKPVVAIKRSGSDLSKTKQLFSYYTSDAERLFQQIKWIEADLCDIYSLLDALEGVDIVYHCAGFVSFNRKDKKELYKTNAEGTANLVNACLEKNIKAFCHVSSIATLQNPDITQNIDESVYWKSSPSASDYAISKYNGEREVWRGIEEGLNAVIVNPGVILSPGFWQQSSGRLISRAYQGNPFYTNGGSAVIHALDVAECMVKLVEQQRFNKRYVLIENNYSFKELLFLIHEHLGKKAPSIEAKKWILKIAQWANGFWSFLSGKEQLITKETVASALERNTYSNHQIKQTISHQFIPLTETVKFVCAAYLKDLKQ